MAIDREGVVAAAEHGIGTVAKSLVTASTWAGLTQDEVAAAQADLPAYDYDPEAAQALAAEAGVDGQQIKIATTPAFQAADIVATAVADAARTIGLDPQIETVSPDQYTTLFADPAARAGYDLFMTYWYTSVADPMDYFATLRTGNFANYSGWSNAEFDEVTATAIATPVDDPSRVDSLRAAEAIAMEELPWLPIYSAPTSVWLGDRITGLSPSINHLYYPWAATIGAK
jgi:peptide/nickel transport system substrate-binding protein